MTDKKTTKKIEPAPATAKQDVEPEATIEFHGKKYDIDTSAMDDIDIMEALTDAKITGDDSQYMIAFTLMLRALLGDDFARWKKEQRAIHGRVGSELMQEFIEAAGGGKS